MSHAIIAATISDAAFFSAVISATSSHFTPPPIQPLATTVNNVFNVYNFNVYTQQGHEANMFSGIIGIQIIIGFLNSIVRDNIRFALCSHFSISCYRFLLCMFEALRRSRSP